MVRSLLNFTSLFPVGCWVRTNTGYVGKVVAAHTNEITRPSLRLYYQGDRKLSAPQTLHLTQHTDIKIEGWAPTPPDLTDSMEGF